MAWIESHQSLKEHPKTKKAARLLKISRPLLIGHLMCFWWWAVDYAPDGDVSKYQAEDIADAAEWEGDPESFVAALVGCGLGDRPGFFDRTEDGRLLIHDWWDYAGKLISQRKANAQRMRDKRAVHVPDTNIARTGATNQPTANQHTDKASCARARVTEPTSEVKPPGINPVDQQLNSLYAEECLTDENGAQVPGARFSPRLSNLKPFMDKPELVRAALQLAKTKNARDPCALAESVLMEWGNAGVGSPEEAQEYERRRNNGRSNRRRAVDAETERRASKYEE